MSPRQVRVIVLCAIVVILDGFDTQCMGFLVPVISDNLHIALPQFGPVLSAALVGLMIAAMGSGPIADRSGRRWVAVISVLAFAVFTLLTARANTLRELVLFRFLTGLGLGGAMPNAVALTSEFTPKRLRPIVIGAMFTGMPAGAVIASQAAGFMIPRWGWRSVLALGGALPLALAIVLIVWLPESVEWMESRARGRATARESVPVKDLFTEGRASGTLLLWIPFFMNLLILYFVLSWLPSLLRQSGLPVAAGVQAVAAFSVNMYTLPLDTFGGASAAFAVSILVAAYGAVQAVISPAFGALIDHYGLAPVCRIAAVSPLAAFGVLKWSE